MFNGKQQRQARKRTSDTVYCTNDKTFTAAAAYHNIYQVYEEDTRMILPADVVIKILRWTLEL